MNCLHLSLVNYLCLLMILNFIMLFVSCMIGLNISKCKVSHIGNAPYTGSYSIAGIQLKLLDEIQDLGIHTDSKLKFHFHTATVVTIFLFHL